MDTLRYAADVMVSFFSEMGGVFFPPLCRTEVSVQHHGEFNSLT